ncbi:purine and uridine phosphorylase [Lophiostoma macrostomum CBS 122681]|uniref:Purine and uridine phosphorylase n=1 Tax=Lophiostoma macrostomum CBS 122681 TaxID=1314788 RepID=A0A6A6TLZ4_9PLEO|nr:purine and uridine phosphorylase [Lophiostoma macrostomum CBS 122681]
MYQAGKLPSRDDFKVAIICAVGKEGDAVEKLFDKKWRSSELGTAPGDENTYTLGIIGVSLVVLVWLAEYGKTPAATAAVDLRSSFQNIRYALVVGICGGVPYSGGKDTNIVLGDVVISTELQEYDEGKQYPEGYRTTGKTKPHKRMGAFISKLSSSGDSRKELKEYSSQHLQRMLKRDLEYAVNAQYPGLDEDVLCSSARIHKHYPPAQCHACSEPEWVCESAKDMSCSDLNCIAFNDNAVVYRKQRKSLSMPMTPSVHFGIVGSGSTVMKSAEHRDLIANREHIIAFEMESAGVAKAESKWSVVVIKAVCDYADSHKKKNWQYYAAALAAAYTGAFLQIWEDEHGHGIPQRKSSSASIATNDSRVSNREFPVDMFPIDIPLDEQGGWGNNMPMRFPSRTASHPASFQSTSPLPSVSRHRTYSGSNRSGDASINYPWNRTEAQSPSPTWSPTTYQSISSSPSPFFVRPYHSQPQILSPPPQSPREVRYVPPSPMATIPTVTTSNLDSHDQNLNTSINDAVRLLLEACGDSNNLTSANVLLKNIEFDLNSRDSKGRSIAHLVIGTANVTSNKTRMTQRATALKLLCFYNVDVTITDASGWTPLHWCVKTANTMAAKYLLDYGVPVNTKDHVGRTPLYLLGTDGSPVVEMAHLLKQAGGNLGGKELPKLSGRPKEVQYTVRNLLRACP